MRNVLQIHIDSPMLFKLQALHWISRFSIASYLNSNTEAYNSSQPFDYNSYDFILAADAVDEIETQAGTSFNQVKERHTWQRDWLFGYWSYDLKNELEKLVSSNYDKLEFAPLHFFRPRYVFILNGTTLRIEFLNEFTSLEEVHAIVAEIQKQAISFPDSKPKQQAIQSKVSQEQYISTVSAIKKHIQRGDIYEMNYCVEFFIENSKLNPPLVYSDLNSISSTPFSCYYKNANHYLMCASPERFLKKIGTKLLCQPIKGTRKRGANFLEDEALKKELFLDPKERSENVMIVDLVRNDLSRSAKRGSVKVEELFGIYSFKQVHQLISTVSAELKNEIHFVDAIKNAFPMGSMTGAPKVRAMQLIEEFETTKRGLYSGAVGYISPEGDFDFNVVIRSILHNAKNDYTSFMVGSAITANSIPENEYKECLLKAEAMFQVLLKK